ncbi:MAG: hypothetical protein C0597_01655 [Marinilabiliales bacterium]|nr:MAG: hypothetical protein C0597_01655 [Marinilabiliales bacterium]
MKKIKYILLFLLSLSLFNSCLVDDEADIDQNDQGSNFAAFELTKIDLMGLANGDAYDRTIKMMVKGHSVKDISSDIDITVEANASSTALDGVHYVLPSNTIKLTKENNYIGLLDITMLTAGNTPPMDGTPEFENYVAPVLNLDIVVADGDSKVIASGKSAQITLNYVSPNPYEGTYDVYTYYSHPTAGVSEDNWQKDLTAITGRKCLTWFAIWDDVKCWITVNADNSITYEVDPDDWDDEVKMGDPRDPSLVSHFDETTGEIYLYYYYTRDTGSRIFHEVFTPTF